eukprot:6488917-Amphidinium_carterae.5
MEHFLMEHFLLPLFPEFMPRPSLESLVAVGWLAIFAMVSIQLLGRTDGALHKGILHVRCRQRPSSAPGKTRRTSKEGVLQRVLNSPQTIWNLETH